MGEPAEAAKSRKQWPRTIILKRRITGLSLQLSYIDVEAWDILIPDSLLLKKKKKIGCLLQEHT